MTLGEKLKAYREREGLTQEELADRLYVTRAAVSKWERDLGYPGIDSLRLIANEMGCTLDELLSEDDAANERRIEARRAMRMYACAVGSFAAAVLFALLAYFLAEPLYCIGAGCGCVAYLVFAFFSKPKWKRMRGNVLYRGIVFFVMLLVVLAVTLAGLLG